MKTTLLISPTLLSFILLTAIGMGQVAENERIVEENPSEIDASLRNGLTLQVGSPIITEREKKIKREKEERILRLEEEERLREQAKLAKIEERKLRPLTPPTTYLGYSGETSVTVKRGDTLGKIATRVYGNPSYSTLISVYNKVPANRVFPGQVIKTPNPHQIFTELDGKIVFDKYPLAIRDILRVHESFKSIEQTLKDEINSTGYSEKTELTLDQLLWEMEQIKTDFIIKPAGVIDYPNSTTTQLHSALTNLKSIRKGDLGKRNLRIQRFHLYLINGYSYALAWGRDGFKNTK